MLKDMSIFISGTDTNVGKSVVSAFLINYFDSLGLRVGYYKPVQSGLIEANEINFVSSMVKSKDVKYSCTYSFKEPISPNLAAQKENVTIDLEKIKNYWDQLDTDRLWIVEGAGGVSVPLNSTQDITNLINMLRLPVVLVSRPQLGTINHTWLSESYLKKNNISCLGFVFSGEYEEEVKQEIEKKVNFLFSIPYFKNLDQLKDNTDFAKIDLLKKIENFFKASSEFELLKKDEKYLWHPFTQHKNSGLTKLAMTGKDEKIQINNNWCIDGISSWWTNLHGHANEEISNQISQQACKLEHVIFANFTHEPAVRFSEQLINKIQTTQPQVEKVFLSDNGSTAVEVALKMAFQAHKHLGNKKTKFLALKGSYHGDTLGAMSVGDPEGYHTVFKPLLCPVDFLDPLLSQDKVCELLLEKGSEYAAVIVEPIIQGAGGMKLYPKELLKTLDEQKKHSGYFIIADEVFTGFGRTGKFLASDHEDNFKPDLICLSKGITGGFLPMGATLATNQIFQLFLSDKLNWAFLHGHSYTGNPLSCAAALKSLEILNRDETTQKIMEISQVTKERIELLKKFEVVKNPRSIGTVGAFDVAGFDGYFHDKFAENFMKFCLDRGVLLRPLGGTIYTLPPYCITLNNLNKIFDVIEEFFNNFKEI